MRFRDQHALLKALRQQDPRALEVAIDEYGGYVTAVALRTLGGGGSRQDAEEVVSDVFVALWKGAGRLAPDSNLKPWLAVVARNTSLKRLRSLKPVQSRSLSLNEDSEQMLAALSALADTAPTCADAADEAQEHPLNQALESLSPTDRELLYRHYDEEQSISAIARATDLSESAVKSRLYRGRKAVRGRLTWRGTLKESRG